MKKVLVLVICLVVLGVAGVAVARPNGPIEPFSGWSYYGSAW